MSAEASASPTPSSVVAAPLALVRLTVRLLARYWPQLGAIVLAGMLARTLLLELSVWAGFLAPLAGLVVLTSVVLADLIATVAAYETLRPAMPALAAARAAARREAGTEAAGEGEPRGAAGFASAVTLVLVPFFAYYAAWGFLGDAVRDYSKLALALTPFGESRNVLDLLGGGWTLVAAVALFWALRRLAKAMKARTGRPVWDVVVVLCEASWAFIGLYVLSHWKDDALTFAAALPEWLARGWEQLFAARAAEAVPPPVEQAGPGVLGAAQGLFFYALYPIVQLTLAAIVFGYDVHAPDAYGGGRAARAIERWGSAPTWARDFLGHFWAGTLKRYRALANGVRLTLGAGLALALSTVVLFRALDWLAAWGWSFAARAIGPHDLGTWQVLSEGVSILFGSPSQPGDGLLILPVKICLLAAALELAFASGRTFRGR